MHSRDGIYQLVADIPEEYEPLTRSKRITAFGHFNVTLVVTLSSVQCAEYVTLFAHDHKYPCSFKKKNLIYV